MNTHTGVSFGSTHFCSTICPFKISFPCCCCLKRKLNEIAKLSRKKGQTNDTGVHLFDVTKPMLTKSNERFSNRFCANNTFSSKTAYNYDDTNKYLSAFALCIVQNLHLHLVEIPDLFSLLSVKLYHHFTLFSTFCCGQIRRSYGEKSAKIGQVVKTLRQAEEDEWKERWMALRMRIQNENILVCSSTEPNAIQHFLLLITISLHKWCKSSMEFVMPPKGQLYWRASKCSNTKTNWEVIRL